MSVSIVIPAYNGWSMTHSLLLDLYKNTPHDTEIIVVDDHSTDKDVLDGLEWWKTGLLDGRLRIFRNESNCGFLRTSNFGVTRASGDVVILVSNDVKVTDKHFVEKLSTAVTTHRDKAIAGARLLDVDTGWNTFNGKTFPYLEGWLLAFRKPEWVELGGFDLRYAPFDFEDVDISTMYIASGGCLVQVDVEAVHLGAQTYKYSPEREAQTKKNQKKFEEKWVTK